MDNSSYLAVGTSGVGEGIMRCVESIPGMREER
jgi:hypothetical protein